MNIFNKSLGFIAYILRRTVFWVGFYIRPPIDWFIGLFSKVGNPPVFNNETFPWSWSVELQ